MLEFDDAAAEGIRRVYSTPDIVRQRAATLDLLDPRPGERILDVGSGPGFLVASLGERVGTGGAVHGLDPSAPMNEIARRLTAARPQVTIDEGDALAMPYPDGAFDAATSTQVYEYVADIAAAFTELRRVVRRGGRVLILDTDWDSVVWHVADRDRHRRIMAAWDGHLADPHLPCTLPGHLRRAGFAVTARTVVPIVNGVLEPETYSAYTMTTIARYAEGRHGITRADTDAWMADLRARAAEGDYLFSVNRYCFLATAE